MPETHPHAQTPAVKLGELEALPFVVLSGTLYPDGPDWLKRVCQSAGFTPTTAHAVGRGRGRYKVLH